MVHSIQSSGECERILGSKDAVMLKFSATWCGPCKAVGPIIDKLAPTFPKVFIADVDIDKCQDIASQHTVSAVPSFIFFRKGTEINRVAGGDVTKVTALLRELSASVGQSFGKGNRLGDSSASASSSSTADMQAYSSSQSSVAHIRELRARAFNDLENRRAQQTESEKTATSPVDKPKPKTRARPRNIATVSSNWSASDLVSNLIKYLVLYFATLFSFDARASAASLSAEDRG